ncbi:MAG: hypothetical protein OHK0017_03900 [Patescibacteria group bacterium]
MEALFEPEKGDLSHENLILTADGGSRGNPGPAAYGFVVWALPKNLNPLQIGLTELQQSFQTENLIYEHGQYIGSTTNNQAEWQGLVNGLDYITQNYHNVKHLFICLDSLLVINQLKGVYKVKNLELKPWHELAIQSVKKLPKVSFQHIYREHNKQADRMVNQALDQLKS